MTKFSTKYYLEKKGTFYVFIYSAAVQLTTQTVYILGLLGCRWNLHCSEILYRVSGWLCSTFRDIVVETGHSTTEYNFAKLSRKVGNWLLSGDDDDDDYNNKLINIK